MRPLTTFQRALRLRAPASSPDVFETRLRAIIHDDSAVADCIRVRDELPRPERSQYETAVVELAKMGVPVESFEECVRYVRVLVEQNDVPIDDAAELVGMGHAVAGGEHLTVTFLVIRNTLLISRR